MDELKMNKETNPEIKKGMIAVLRHFCAHTGQIEPV